jgi:epoxyqueuosine reductase
MGQSAERNAGERLKAFVARTARELGFDQTGIVRLADLDDRGPLLAEFLRLGRHGSMGWMEETAERRGSPVRLWPEARSAIMLGMNYGPDTDPRETLSRPDRATISVYARNRDYHDLIKGRLKELAGRFAARSGADVKVFVDTAPLMEKPLAMAAGLGWQGRHTNLVSRELGSWLFLGSILTSAELPPDQPEADHCGSCRACLDICPTAAFPAPYQLDARRCISYLTIEHKGPIPDEFRVAMGNRIYGCDDCLAVCPWNKFAREASETKLSAREDLKAPALDDLAMLDDAAFRAFFSGSPVKRIGRDRFLRNVLIAIGNSGRPDFIARCLSLAGDGSPLVRGAAIWALSRLQDRRDFAAFAEKVRLGERDDGVLRELNAGACRPD